MQKIKIDVTGKQQKMDGWGTSLCWWANAAGGWTMKGETGTERREELMKLFFSEEGLDFNIVRYNIGGGDNPAEPQHMFHFRGLPCYKPSSDAAFQKEADWRQLWVLKKAKELQKDRLIHEVFVNSPPWWMTNSLCSSGNVEASMDNLDASRYEEFAVFCADVLEFLQNEANVPVDYFDPMNEAGSDYWAKGQRQEGNKVTIGENQSHLLSSIYNELQKRKLNIAVTASDETNPTVALNSYLALEDEVKEKVLKKINYHHYAEDKEALKKLGEIAYPEGFINPRYTLWMDEVCYGDGKDNIDLAKSIVFAIEADLNIAHASAWLIWQAMDTMSENILNKCHWGLVEGMYQDKDNNELEGVLDITGMGFDYGEYVITTEYYVMGHYSRYIKPGYTILQNDGEDFYCVSAMSPDEKMLVAVLYNEHADRKTISLDLSGFIPKRTEIIRTDDSVKWETREYNTAVIEVELNGKSIVTIRYEA